MPVLILALAALALVVYELGAFVFELVGGAGATSARSSAR